MSSDSVTLTVQGAEKRDAGRGVARIAEPTRKRLGVLSGDTIVIDGAEMTLVKVWPAAGDLEEDAIRIDGDTRANAGVKIGDSVEVYARGQDGVEVAETVTLSPPASLSSVERVAVQAAVSRNHLDRPVSPGEQLRLEVLSEDPFKVVGTTPEGPVRIGDDTHVTVARSHDPTSGTGEGDEGTGTTYEDIGGLDEELELVREMIELPLSEPELFQQFGVDPPQGVLLHGPPGTGKTLIAKAVANEVDANFVTINGPEIMNKYKGESEERIRDRFEEARENAPTILFFDEVDSIAGQRDESGDVENRVVAQLLSEMDGLEGRGQVIVIGATNRVDAIDPALRRPGRFDREIEIGVPNAAGREEILEVLTRGMPLAPDVRLKRYADRTHGFVGADLDALTSEAAMAAIRRRPADPEEREAWDDTVTKGDFETAMASVEPSAMREFVAEQPTTTFDDVGGLADAKATLREAVEWPLTYDRLFEATNTTPPSGVLLYGPPGTGKTLLARALAGESEVNFVSVKGPELMDRFVGESEKAVREVFDRARQAAPSILFFDEIDAITGQRGAGTHEATERVVSQLLTELDGLAENPNLVVLAATNRKEAIDDAILRPGRLDQHVLVPLPDEAARREILAVHTRGKPLGDDVDLDALAAELGADGRAYSGADIEAICREAAMRAIREVADAHDPEAANERADEVTITREHFERAIDEVAPSGA